MANYMSAKQAAESQPAQTVLEEVRRNFLIGEEENTQQRKSLPDAELALANAEARRLQDVASAYAKCTLPRAARPKA
jgi:hypothetical protein